MWNRKTFHDFGLGERPVMGIVKQKPESILLALLQQPMKQPRRIPFMSNDPVGIAQFIFPGLYAPHTSGRKHWVKAAARRAVEAQIELRKRGPHLGNGGRTAGLGQ